MKIDSISIKGFGCISERYEKLSEGANFIYGKNGSGKTTFIEFLKYMIQDGKSLLNEAELKKYKPFYAGNFGGEMKIIFEDGTAFDVKKDFDNLPDIHESNKVSAALCGVEPDKTIFLSQESLEIRDYKSLSKKIAEILSSSASNTDLLSVVKMLRERLTEAEKTIIYENKKISQLEKQIDGLSQKKVEIKSQKQLTVQVPVKSENNKNRGEKLASLMLGGNNYEIASFISDIGGAYIPLAKKLTNLSIEYEKNESMISKINSSINEVNFQNLGFLGKIGKWCRDTGHEDFDVIKWILSFLSLISVIFISTGYIFKKPEFFDRGINGIFFVAGFLITGIFSGLKIFTGKKIEKHLKKSGYTLDDIGQNEDTLSISQNNNAILKSIEKVKSDIINIFPEDTGKEPENINTNINENMYEKIEEIKHEIDRTTLELLEMENEKEKLLSERDTLCICIESLNEADAELGREFAPRLSQKAEDYIKKIDPDFNKEFKTDDNFFFKYIEPEKNIEISQDYMGKSDIVKGLIAVRLAIRDILSENNESLPIIIDDLLLFQDNENTYKLMENLKKFSSKFQIIITGTQRELEIAKKTGFNIIYL